MTHDTEADAIFVRLSDEQVHDSMEVQPGIILDYSKDGRLVAIEVLNASRVLATSASASAIEAAPPHAA